MMDSGAIINVMYKKMAELLCVKPEEAARTITVATEDKSPVVGMIREVQVAFANMVVNLDLLVVEGSPFVVIIGVLPMEDLKGIINIGKRTSRLTRETHTVELPLGPDY